MRNYRAVLRCRGFTLIWTGRVISSLGDWVRNIAIIWLVKELTGSALAMGTVTLCTLLPYLIFGLFAGSLVDLVDRKRVMVWSDLGRGLLTLVVPAIILAGHVQFWHLCLAGFVLSSISAFFNPAVNATIPNVVPHEHLLAANSLNSLTMQMAGLLGPALGGLIVGAAGAVPALLADSLSFFVSGLAILAAPIPGRPTVERRLAEEAAGAGTDADTPTGSAAGAGASLSSDRARKVDVKSTLAGIGEGLRFILRQRLLLVIILFGVGLNFVVAPAMIVSAIHVDRVWHAGAEAYGALNSVFSFGAVIGALVATSVVGRLGWDNTMAGSLLLQGLVGFGLVFAADLAQGLLVFLLLGMTESLVNVPLATWLQRTVPDQMRGRVFAAAEVGIQLASPLGMALAGSATDAFGTVAIFAVMAAVTTLGGIALKWVFARYTGAVACPPASG